MPVSTANVTIPNTSARNTSEQTSTARYEEQQNNVFKIQFKILSNWQYFRRRKKI